MRRGVGVIRGPLGRICIGHVERRHSENTMHEEAVRESNVRNGGRPITTLESACRLFDFSKISGTCQKSNGE